LSKSKKEWAERRSVCGSVSVNRRRDARRKRRGEKVPTTWKTRKVILRREDSGGRVTKNGAGETASAARNEQCRKRL